MPNKRGRKPGLILHSEGFEALIAGRHLKKDVAADAGMSAGFLADLLAHRGGASPVVAERLASSLAVPVAAIFPEVVGWVAPPPAREGTRGATS